MHYRNRNIKTLVSSSVSARCRVKAGVFLFNMKRFVYSRVSTDRQSYERQDYTIKSYFAQKGINPESITAIVKEKISTRKDIAERGFSDLIKSCEKGDYIYVDCLDRIGRTQLEMMELIENATKNGIHIISCSDGMELETDSDVGRLMISFLTALANIERNRISARTKATLASYKEQIDKKGYFVSKDGKRCERLGRERGCDLTKAREASTKSKQEKAALYRMNNKGYQSVKRWIAQGQTTEWILAEFNEHHKSDPENYCTMTGKPLTESTLKQWRVEIKNAVAV